MMKFKNIYNNFDLLNIPISLSFKNKYLYQTYVGATLTIIFTILIIIYFFNQVVQIIRKSSFSIISNEYQNPKESINFTNVPILFALTNDLGIPLDFNPKMVTYSVILNEYIAQYDKDGNTHTTHTQKNIETERCDKLKDTMDLSLFKDYNISYFQCIKPFQNITINGSYGDINGYKSLKISIKKCNSKDDNNIVNKCFNSEYIDSVLSNSRFIVIYLGYKTNFYHLNEKDIEQTIYSRSITISPSFLKRVFYYMTLVKYNLYDNIFRNSKKETIYYINRAMIIENEPIKDESYDKDTLAYYSFVYDGNVVEYIKTVEKIIDAIAYIGNFFNIMLTLFKIINNYFSNKILFIDIFYKFFFENRFRKSKTVHFDKDNSKKENNSKEGKDFLSRKSHKNLLTLQINNKDKNKSITSNFDSSIYLDNFAKSNKNLNILNIKSGRNFTNQPKSKRSIHLSNKTIIKEKNEFIKFSKFYYLFPRCCIRNKKNLDNLLFIKNSICSCFSLETFIEFAKFKKAVSTRGKNKNNSFVFDEKNWVSSKNFKEEISKIFGL